MKPENNWNNNGFLKTLGSISGADTKPAAKPNIVIIRTRFQSPKLNINAKTPMNAPNIQLVNIATFKIFLFTRLITPS